MEIINPTMNIIIYGATKCNFKCTYCNGHLTRDRKIKIDEDALIKTITESEKFKEIKRKFTEIQFTIWGSEPLYHFEEFKKVVDILYKHFSNEFETIISTSTNGYVLKNREIVDYLIDNNILLQLSHDGVCEYLRHPTFDPLLDEQSSQNIIELINRGILQNINCVCSKQGTNIYEHVNFFNKWRFEHNLLEFFPRIRFSPLEGNEDNKDLFLDGEAIDEFLFTLLKLYCHMKKLPDDEMKTAPYRNGVNKFLHENWFNRNAICKLFQEGKSDWSITIDTLGKYTECDLLDSSQHLDINRGQVDIAKCKECECYKNHFNFCNSCYLNTQQSRCEFAKKYLKVIKLVEEIDSLDVKTIE